MLKSTSLFEAPNPPYGQAVVKWKTVAEHVSKSNYMKNLGSFLSWGSARSRFELLPASFERNDTANRVVGGLEEECREKEQLLQDMLDEKNYRKQDAELKSEKK